MSTTLISRHVNAPRTKVYRALLDARTVAKLAVPPGMTSEVHACDAREGGAFQISLTYDAPTARGSTTELTDTYRGRFLKLRANKQIVEVVEFETADPAVQGRVTITIWLSSAQGGTDILAVRDGPVLDISERAGYRDIF